MPKKPNDDLAAFQEWMVTEHYLTERTASVYACKVRKTLRTCSESITPQTLEACFTGVAFSVSENPDGSETSYTPLPVSKAERNLFYAAWVRFSEYIKVTMKIDLPQPPPRKNDDHYSVPEEVWECVSILKQRYKMPLVDLFTYYTCDMVSKRGRMYEMKDKRHASAWITLRADHIEPILLWATEEGAKPNAPFFPSPCDGEECMPRKILNKMWKDYQKAQSPT
jgi:hypothetical protein